MKFFKNTVVILVLFAIGYTDAKQVGKKTTTTPSSSANRPAQTPSKIPTKPQSQQQLQPSTFREFITELRRMKTSDVFTSDKKFSDKIVHLFARVIISPLDRSEINVLREALFNLHAIGTILNIEDIVSKSESELGNIIIPLFNDLDTRVNALVKQQRPDLFKEKSTTSNQPDTKIQTMQKTLTEKTNQTLQEWVVAYTKNNTNTQEDAWHIKSAIDGLFQDIDKDYSWDERKTATDIVKVAVIDQLSFLPAPKLIYLVKYLNGFLSDDLKDIAHQLNERTKVQPSKEKIQPTEQMTRFEQPKTPTYKPSVTKEKEQELPKKEVKKDQTPTEADEASRQTNVLTGCISAVLRKHDGLDDENALWHILDPGRRDYNFDKIKTVFDSIITEANKCSDNQGAIEYILINRLKKDYFEKLNQEQQKQIIKYIKEKFDSL